MWAEGSYPLLPMGCRQGPHGGVAHMCTNPDRCPARPAGTGGVSPSLWSQGRAGDNIPWRRRCDPRRQTGATNLPAGQPDLTTCVSGHQCRALAAVLWAHGEQAARHRHPNVLVHTHTLCPSSLFPCAQHVLCCKPSPQEEREHIVSTS